MAFVLAAPARAADPSDPEWPCIQRKVEHLSPAAMWPHPFGEEVAPLSPDLEELAARLALRRVSEEEARALVAEAAADHPDLGLPGYGHLFQATFDHIDRQRARILSGITRYARNQTRLSSELDSLRAEMAWLEAAENPDFDRMDEVEARIDWHVRVFNDRARALTYVCESPILLEQRAYVIAQMLLKAAG
ncbi:hypothetical protein [Rubellimicrobium aerolatum]|uniref:DUF1311 domain-containing protein n=1 Tax=Rubellimicrobium aerolatum TaxID=490979 RepID=A0ABW0SGC3_9RHOB|nr:hypothetical protein [Rubellimicrobium aerolatum]MBP1807432.1 hypothetical protein [Rubellimicrobium aerolatum]